MNVLIDRIQNAGVKAAETVGAFVKDTGNMGRVVKVAVSCLEFLGDALGCFPETEGLKSGVKLLHEQFKTTDSVVKATNIFTTAHELADDGERAKITKSWQKATSRGFLTVGQMLDTVGFIDKVSLDYFAKYRIGDLKTFDLAKNIFVLISSGLSIWNAINQILDAQKRIDDVQARQDKWKQRKIELGSPEDFNRDAVISRYHKKLANEWSQGAAKDQDKIDNWNDYLAKLEADGEFLEKVKNFQEAKIERLKNKMDRKPERAEKLNYYIQAAQENQVGRLADHKVKKCSIRIENETISEKQSWVSIVSDIAKIAIIILGSAALALCVKYAWLKSTDSKLIIGFIGIIASSCGLFKALYKEMGPQTKQEPGDFSAVVA